MANLYGWKSICQPGQFGFDNMCMSIGRLFQNFTVDVETASHIVHEAWIENYTYWVKNKPWERGYKKPKNALGDERREKCASTKYVDLPESEKEKDRIIAKYIINNHLDYRQFVKTFNPHNLKELEDKTLIFDRQTTPYSIQPTVFVDEDYKTNLKQNIELYKQNFKGPIYKYRHDLYIGPTSQVALTRKYKDKLKGSKGVVISIDEVDGEEIPLVKFLDNSQFHIKYIDGKLPLMMAAFVPITAVQIEFALEMCVIDGYRIPIDKIAQALKKARSFHCVEVKNLPSMIPETVLDLIVDIPWKNILKETFTSKSQFIVTFSSWLWDEYKMKNVLPSKSNIFAALNMTTFENVKVVIIGQEPHSDYQRTHGLSFSSYNGTQSFRNINIELERSGFVASMNSGNLTKWAEQGVLLLNIVLTVCSGKPNSHINKGWEIITDKIIHQINLKKDNVVFMLWGTTAQRKIAFIDLNRHYVLTANYPTTTGYVGCNCFINANNYLNRKGIKDINWNLN
jgi:uracil-DNA glycosylase